MTAWFGKRIKLPRGGASSRLFLDWVPMRTSIHPNRSFITAHGTSFVAHCDLLGNTAAQPHFDGTSEKVIRRECTQKLLLGHNTLWTWLFVKENCVIYRDNYSIHCQVCSVVLVA